MTLITKACQSIIIPSFYFSGEGVAISVEDVDVRHAIRSTPNRSTSNLATNDEDLRWADGEGSNVTPWSEGVAGEFDQYPLRSCFATIQQAFCVQLLDRVEEVFWFIIPCISPSKSVDVVTLLAGTIQTPFVL